HVAVGILDLETTETVVSVFQRFGKRDIPRTKFGREGVGIGNVNVGIPARDTLLHVSRVIRSWRHADRLQQDLSTALANDPEKDVVRRRPLERDLESKPVPVKRKR